MKQDIGVSIGKSGVREDLGKSLLFSSAVMTKMLTV